MLQCVFCGHEATWQAKGQPLCLACVLMNEGREPERLRLEYLDYLNSKPEPRLSFEEWRAEQEAYVEQWIEQGGNERGY